LWPRFAGDGSGGAAPLNSPGGNRGFEALFVYFGRTVASKGLAQEWTEGLNWWVKKYMIELVWIVSLGVFGELF
jgi:hypothetical protein